MKNITYRTNDQLWRIEDAAAAAGYKKTNDCYWAQIFRNEKTGHEFSTRREENSTNDPAADLAALLNPDEEIPAEETQKTQPKKEYTYTEGHAHEETTSAAQALTWHRMGRNVTVWGRRPNGDAYHVGIAGASQPTKEDENRNYCKHIALELEAYADGNVRRCPECGEVIDRTEWNDVGDKFKCPHCSAVVDTDDLEQLNIYDYVADALDIEYRINASDRDTVQSVRVMVACGGPNIYIDTAAKAVELYWWSERASHPISYDAADALEEWAQEMWGCC